MNHQGESTVFGVENETENSSLVREILSRFPITPADLAKYLGTSLVSVVRWGRGDTRPEARIQEELAEILRRLEHGGILDVAKAVSAHVFASRGVRRGTKDTYRDSPAMIDRTAEPVGPLLQRLKRGAMWGRGPELLAEMLADHVMPAKTVQTPIAEGVSAGKNTYTYDAHTYHTKVPPQGIAQVIRNYLPEGGIVLDPFAGSGMTGVASLAVGADVVLNELSPAAGFIADRFTRSCTPETFTAAVKVVCDELGDLRRRLYSTLCRSCGKETEILYTVWSYRVKCDLCEHEFLLWDHCRSYGKTVREHKILSDFPCPCCKKVIKKSRLRRTSAQPVLVGYKCCTRYQVEAPLTDADFVKIGTIEATPPLAEGFYPTLDLPDGVNLCQPKRHGLTSVDRLYTPRNLSAMSHLWREINRIQDSEIVGFLAFVFTSLYQRVTRLSEFRFWGGSGNTAHFNVPYIFNEANVFVTFERKARTIQDHLETTARSYTGRCVVRTGSATDLDFLPDDSIDLIFTDPPFGANINYSEMNILWESWLGEFTDSKDEAIVNRFQNKDVAKYGELMTSSLRESFRVLRPGHWMMLVFMNSSQEVWRSLREAVLSSGFSIERVDIFDKQHGTFKQFVSDNTAGCDLLLHCLKPEVKTKKAKRFEKITDESVERFLTERRRSIPMLPYLHVDREEEIDFRMLYSEFLAASLMNHGQLLDFTTFREVAANVLCKGKKKI